MRQHVLIVMLVGLAACSTARPPAVAPASHAQEDLSEADALLRAGCFDCFLSAYHAYDRLRTVPSVADAAAAGAARTALLLAIRERELGTEDSGYFALAGDLAAASPAAREAVGSLLEIADTLPSRVTGGSRQVTDDRALARMQQGYAHRDAWLAQLRAHANDDPADAYVWVAFNCTYPASTRDAIGEWLAAVPAWRDSQLLAFKKGTCGTFDGAVLDQLLTQEPRFLEVNYFLGLRVMIGGHLDDADTLLERAYTWRPRWPAVTNALGSVAMSAEDFERSAQFFDRTLDVSPRNPDGLLGSVRALTYLGRHDAALAAVDRLLALEHWYVGDARYWRALNEAQLGRNDDAWADVEIADKLIVNAEVPKLAGMVAYRLHHFDVAQKRFEVSRDRDPADCETAFYLGIVLSDERFWPKSAEVFIGTSACLDAAQAQYTEEIAKIRASADPPDRRDRQIAKREQQIVEARRMQATSWFDTAIAYYNLQQKADARLFAEKVSTDEQFGERARDLLSRLAK
jgi:tetratricopeptide (TPR) repeat protein